MTTETIQAGQMNPEENYNGMFGVSYWTTGGRYGIARQKTDGAPRFNAGDQVTWEVSRNFKGVDMIKVGVPGHVHGGAPAAPPPAGQPPAQTGGQAPAAPAQPRFLGIQIGAAMNNACLLLCHEVERIDPEGETLQQAVWRISSQLLIVSETLQRGKLHGERAAQQQAAPPPQRTPPPPAQQSAPPPPPQGGQPGAPSMRGHQAHLNPNGDALAFNPNDFEEDVPF